LGFRYWDFPAKAGFASYYGRVSKITLKSSPPLFTFPFELP